MTSSARPARTPSEERAAPPGRGASGHGGAGTVRVMLRFLPLLPFLLAFLLAYLSW